MSVALAWLDNTAEEQRRINEFISYFTEKSTLDEVGIGQIRDAISDLLFPGTSTLLTRARYFLIVPWCYKKGGVDGRAIERKLIDVLKDEPGAFGSRSGSSLTRLPSDVYWGGLRRLGILRRDVQRSSLVPDGHHLQAESDEQVGRPQGNWHPTIEPAPNGFPNSVSGGLSMTPSEAQWLRERMKDAAPETLLGHLAMADRAPDKDAQFPWEDALLTSAPASVTRVVEHAQRFSFVADGMQRLYRVLLSEEQATRFQRDSDLEGHRAVWDDYVHQAELQRSALEAWDIDEFWTTVRRENPNIGLRTKVFVDEFLGLLRAGQQAIGSEAARELVRNREHTLKRSQSRFENTKLLDMWRSTPGGSALSYRWSNVKTIMTDIQEGLRNAGA